MNDGIFDETIYFSIFDIFLNRNDSISLAKRPATKGFMSVNDIAK